MRNKYYFNWIKVRFHPIVGFCKFIDVIYNITFPFLYDRLIIWNGTLFNHIWVKNIIIRTFHEDELRYILSRKLKICQVIKLSNLGGGR